MGGAFFLVPPVLAVINAKSGEFYEMTMRLVFVLAATLILPCALLAAGGGDNPPRKPAVICTDGRVYAPEQGKCVEPKSGALDREALYQAARQLAYVGRYTHAQAVLDALPADDPGRLTYMGFTYRKLGERALALSYYQRAIAQDPSNILARSYMGQGFVETGDITMAWAQLQQIRAHGGRGSWSERSLAAAIDSGETFDY